VQRTDSRTSPAAWTDAAKHKDDIAFMRLDRELNALVIEARTTITPHAR
jgi:hypothetical protein